MLLVAACKPVAESPQPAPAAAQTEQRSAQTRLDALIAEEWQRTLRTSPILATYLGDPRYNDRWDDMSFEQREAANKADQGALEQLAGIPRAELAPARQTDYDLFHLRLEDRIEEFALGVFLMPVNQLEGVQLLSQIAGFAPFATVKDYENWLTRLQSLGALIDQNVQLMQRGMAAGRMRPRLVIQRVLPQVEAQLVTRAADSPFFKPFQAYPDAVPPGMRAQLTVAAESAVLDSVVPAYARLKTFLEWEYLPACPESPSVSQQPDGVRLYASRVRRHTTTTLTPAQIHEIGLREVARIREQMATVMKKADWRRSPASFFEFLRSDPGFRYSDGAQLLDAYRVIAKRIDPELPRLFGKLPRMPYGVKQVPDIAAPSAPAAYYYPPAADRSRAGNFHANLSQPETRNTWEMEALTAHEAVPGHHLQIALAQELEGLPDFRRYALDYTAFVEGWGLYAESLGGELGLYADPYSKFGQLSFEMWRAARLVVDTGIHAKGWSRAKAIDYFKVNAPKSITDIEVEVDRYIADPGQALAYKIGELRIQALRKRAAEKLGQGFDLRAFHDLVLGSGPLPLDLLEAQVDAWIAAQAAVPK
ncbi:MAG: DUF885 domain-containing protein [Panacagrimonas sp.]